MRNGINKVAVIGTGVIGAGHLAGGDGGGLLRAAVGVFEATALGGHTAVDGAVVGAGEA